MKLLAYIQLKHNLIFKLGMVLICSFLLGLMLPNREVKGHYADSFTAVWPYEDLVTDQDFLIKKTQAELEAEKEQIEKDVPVFFELRVDERNQKMNRLDKLIQTDPVAYAELQPLFDSIYRRGVIESTNGLEGKNLFVVNGNFAQPASYKDFFTIRSAADYLEKHVKDRNLNVNYPDYLAITHYLNEPKSALYLNSRLEQMSVYKNMGRAGEVLVKRGEPLTPAKRELINAYFDLQNSSSSFSGVRFFARWALALILCMVLLFFLAFFRKLIFGQNQQVAFLFLVLFVSVFTVFLFYKYGLMVLALPFTLVPILVRVFFDGRTALFTHLMVVLLCSFFYAR